MFVASQTIGIATTTPIPSRIVGALQRWSEARQWRGGGRPRRFGPVPQLFDKVVTLVALTGNSGAPIGPGTEGTVVDAHPPDSLAPTGYAVEVPIGKDEPGAPFDVVIVKPYELVVAPASRR